MTSEIDNEIARKENDPFGPHLQDRGRPRPSRFRWGHAWRAPALFAVVSIAFVVSAPGINTYQQSILTTGFLFAIGAVTVDVLWGYTGILSYAQSAFFGIGAYSVAIYFTHNRFSWTAILIPLAAGIAATIVAALIVGMVSFHRRADWLFIAVVTFAAPFLFQNGMLAGGNFTGSSSGLSGFVAEPLSVNTAYLISGIGLLAVTFGSFILVRSDMGKVLRAIRENEERCRYLGIPVHRIKIVLFVVMACVAAAAGFFYACAQSVVAPDVGGFLLGTEMVIWAAVGGRGTLFGPIARAIGINYLTAYLGGTLPFVWQLIIGAVFVVVVIFLPGGVASILERIRRLIWRATKLQRNTAIGASGVNIVATKRVVPESMSLQAVGVSQRFGSFCAVDDVNLEATTGELLSIVGPNGAGKTTFMRCISNGMQRTSGKISVGGKRIGRRGPERVCKLGVAQKFQVASVFDALTVHECLRVARYQVDRPSLWRSASRVGVPETVGNLLLTTGLYKAVGESAANLSHGEKQALELSMVMCTEPSIVLLDEPTAGLTYEERTAVGSAFQRIAQESRAILVLVEHDLDFVRSISTRMVVLHQGRLLMDGSVDEVVGSAVVREIYTGTGGGAE